MCVRALCKRDVSEVCLQRCKRTRRRLLLTKYNAWPRNNASTFKEGIVGGQIPWKILLLYCRAAVTHITLTPQGRYLVVCCVCGHVVSISHNSVHNVTTTCNNFHSERKIDNQQTQVHNTRWLEHLARPKARDHIPKITSKKSQMASDAQYYT